MGSALFKNQITYKRRKKNVYTKKKKKTTRPARIPFFVICRVPNKNFFRPQYSLSLTQIRTLKLFGQFVILCVNSLLQPCTYINCVFNEKMKKKILTHTPLFLYYRTSIVTT